MMGIPFMKYKWAYFAISLLVLIPGSISLVVFGLRLSVDFTGGSLLEIQSKSAISQQVFKDTASKSHLELSSVVTSSDLVYLLRFKPLTQAQNDTFKLELEKAAGKITERRFETVGPAIGSELTKKAILSIVVASLFIILYISWAFRTIPKPYTSWKFGVSAVVALIHDALVVLGIFSIFGHYYKVEVDSLFITALLTVIGFSVHDTIVVFDRIRENMPKLPKASFSDVVDFSLTETLGRSLNTSLTVVLTLTSLLLFGGETTRWFVTALLVGVVSGTFSSIFNAAPLLVLWEEKGKK